MGVLVRRYSDGYALEFDDGRFDQYCVFVVRPDGSRYAPLDTEYFGTLVALANSHGLERVYADFVAAYDATERVMSRALLDLVETAAFAYGDDRVIFARTMTTLVMGMIAENNKAHAVLGKRVKRLGVHRILHEGMDIQAAADFMKGMPWRDIDAMCVERGF